MVVGVLTVDLHFPENGSLKGKRMVLRRILDRVRQRFNVSAAEVEHQDLWQRSRLAIACVNTSGREADSTLAHVLNHISGDPEAVVVGSDIEIR